MATPVLLQRFLRRQTQRDTRRAAATAAQDWLPLRALPALADLPLVVLNGAGDVTDLELTVRAGKCLQLAGPSGSGRSLALRQLALRWAVLDADAPLFSFLWLPTLDDSRTSPQTLVETLPGSSNQVSIWPWQPPRPSMPRARTAVGLFVAGLDELPLSRRADWRDMLADSTRIWPTLQLIVVVPEDEPAWIGFERLTTAPPTAHIADRWVKHLAPEAQQGLLREALAPGSCWAPPAGHLADVALLAWTVSHFGMPRNHADLYGRALILARDLAPEAALTGYPQVRTYVAARRLAAAADTVALEPMPGLDQGSVLEDSDAFDLRQPSRPGEPPLRPLERSSQFIRSIEPRARTDLIRLAAGLAADPSELYAAVWNAGWPDSDTVILLGACLLERPDGPAGWTCRIAEAVAGLAAQEGASAASQASVLLTALMPTLERALATGEVSPSERLRVAAALLDQPGPALRLAAVGWLAVLARPDSHPFDHTLEASDRRTAEQCTVYLARACADQDPRVRATAVAALDGEEVRHGRATLVRLAHDCQAGSEAQLDAVRQLLATGPNGWPDLEGCLAESALPLFARLLIVRAAPEARLTATIGDTRCHPAVRTAAVRRIAGHTTDQSAVELLSLLDLPDMPAPVVEGLCEAVAILGLWPALPVLLDLLDRSMDDIELTLGIIRSLGLLGAEAALEPLESLLGAGAYERLRHAAGQCTLQQPAAACLVQGGLPEVLADRLAVALAGSTVSADQPTTLEEFLRREADLLRAAAACALARVGGPRAQAILRAALVDEHTRGAAAALLNALAEAHPPTGATALADVIAAANVSMAVRWLAIERLATHPDGELPMVRLLDSADLDPFVQGALAEGLGRRGAREAAPRLRALARDRQTDNHLRAQAVCGLALAGGPVAETTLLQLIDDLDEDADLRGLAAEQLPQITTPEVLRRLRGHLNDPRVPAPLAAGILHALGRARDREALPLLLQYCQGETPAVALAALRALADVGDPVVTPILVRISQTPQTDRTVRLQAVGVLIELGGDVYRALLQPYLTRSTLPVRLQALDLLIHAGAPASKLYAMLADRSLPLAMRLRLFEYCSAVSAVVPVFAQIVAETDDDIELRSLAALHLGDVRADTAEPLLAALASDETVALRLRLCCIAALGAIGGTAAGLVLSRLAEDAGQPLVLRRRALAALQRLIEEATDDA